LDCGSRSLEATFAEVESFAVDAGELMRKLDGRKALAFGLCVLNAVVDAAEDACGQPIGRIVFVEVGEAAEGGIDGDFRVVKKIVVGWIHDAGCCGC
jgi:hypothetical protein